MRVRFCGVRGSTPAPGADFAGVGGHTSCIAITPPGATRPRLLLDAGTGVRSVTALLGGGPFRGSILLTHLHWDHWQGLPFFVAADRDDAEVRVLLPDGGSSPLALLRRAMSPPHFPIGPDELRGRWRFEAVEEGRFEVEGVAVTAVRVPHKGGPTFGYRLEGRTGALVYLPDHRPAAGGADRARVVQLCRGAAVLVHGAPFTAAEAAVAHSFGHGTVEEALALAREAGVGELALFHHGPGRTDAAVETIGAEAAIAAGAGCGGVLVTVAREGDERRV